MFIKGNCRILIYRVFEFMNGMTVWQPKTGEQVQLAGKHVPHFKPGKEMRDRVNDSLHRFQTTYFNP